MTEYLAAAREFLGCRSDEDHSGVCEAAFAEDHACVTLAALLDAEIAKAVAAEREACLRATCRRCREGEVVHEGRRVNGDAIWTHPLEGCHMGTICAAGDIRARGQETP